MSDPQVIINAHYTNENPLSDPDYHEFVNNEFMPVLKEMLEKNNANSMNVVTMGTHNIRVNNEIERIVKSHKSLTIVALDLNIWAFNDGILIHYQIPYGIPPTKSSMLYRLYRLCKHNEYAIIYDNVNDTWIDTRPTEEWDPADKKMVRKDKTKFKSFLLHNEWFNDKFIKPQYSS